MTHTKNRRDPDESCLDKACLDAITGPFRWSQQNEGLVDFDEREEVNQSGVLNFYDLAPRGWWCKVDIIAYSQLIETAIPVVVEFFAPDLTAVLNTPVVRLLNGTAAGGADVHHYVNTNSGNGWIVPVADNGRPWNLRIITLKGLVDTQASIDVFYRYIPRVG